MDNSNTKQKLIIQVVCILLSIGLWFYVTNTENPLMVNDLNKVPVEIINTEYLMDSKLVLAPNQEFYVNLKIEGLSQDLRKVNRENFEIRVDLSEYALKKGENKIPVNIIDYPSKINIKNNNSLTITIIIEEYIEKEVPITSNIEIIAMPNYYVAQPTFNPETIKIGGPSSIVERVQQIVAQGQEANVSETIIKDYNIEAIDNNGNVVTGIDIAEKSVEATIKVNKGKVVPINVNTTGALKDGLKLKSMELESKEVEISGPQEVIDTVAEIATEAINLSDITDTSNIEVALKIPDGVQVNLGEKKIKVNVVIDKAISKEYTVGFVFVGVKDGLKAVSSDESIKVIITGFEDELALINNENIKAELDAVENTEVGEFTGIPKVEIVGVNLPSPVEVEVVDKISYELSIKEENT